MATTSWQPVVAAGWIGATALLVPERPVERNAVFAGALAYNVALGTGLAWMALYYAMRRMRAGYAALGTLGSPVVGVLAAWRQLGERPSPLEALGMGLIAAGLAGLVAAGMRSPEGR
jgi:drug/metabolite transporter (DMT)-like permease